jgi:hypothetical protein
MRNTCFSTPVDSVGMLKLASMMSGWTLASSVSDWLVVYAE